MFVQSVRFGWFGFSISERDDGFVPPCRCSVCAGALIAPGVMVTQSNEGFEVVQCTGVGPITMVLDLDDTQDHGDENPCGWAAQFAATPDSFANPPASPMPRDMPLWQGAVLVGLAVSLAFPMAALSLLAVFVLDFFVISRIPILRRLLS